MCDAFVFLSQKRLSVALLFGKVGAWKINAWYRGALRVPQQPAATNGKGRRV